MSEAKHYIARHFTQPRRPFQIPCTGTGKVVFTLESQIKCPDCEQGIVLTKIKPSVERGGDWQKP